MNYYTAEVKMNDNSAITLNFNPYQPKLLCVNNSLKYGCNIVIIQPYFPVQSKAFECTNWYTLTDLTVQFSTLNNNEYAI